MRLSEFVGRDREEERNALASEPVQRAKDRIRKLIERGVNVEKHTMLRFNRTTNPSKVLGIAIAAQEFGMGEVAKAAKKKYKQLTGMTMPRVKAASGNEWAINQVSKQLVYLRKMAAPTTTDVEQALTGLKPSDLSGIQLFLNSLVTNLGR